MLNLRSDLAKIANDVQLDCRIAFPKLEWRDGLAIRTPNWLGDAAMCLPAIKLLRSVVPKDCAIFAVTIPSLSPLFESVECIDRVLVLPGPHKLWRRSDIIRLRRSNCGAAILLNNSLRDASFFRVAMPLRRIYGASARGRSLFFTKSFEFPQDGLLSKEHHHASRYLSMAYSLGAKTWDASFPLIKDIKEPEITPREIIQASEMENILAVAPGAAYGPAKKWPVANFAKICDWWINENNGSVVILGAQNEKRSAEELGVKLKSKKLVDLAGKTDIPDLIKILKKSSFCVSNDSGIMHLSAAVGGAGLAIFGSTNPFATGPLSGKWSILYSEEKCSPCLKRECRFSHYNCLKNIEPRDVILAISETKEKSVLS
ncbi:MAG TPA: lipopolysaccharide heptosyltransferase II [Victivallales bacterium]|nr:lipopolysaccharide heptosyltransferase II [Victivallales bacterium]